MASGPVRAPAEVARLVAAALVDDGVALVRVWLWGPGDQCGSCPFRQVCPDRSRCLHLVASAGTSRIHASGPNGLGGSHARVPLGVRKVGLVARTRRPMVAAGLRGTEAWVADPAWVAGEGIRSFAGFPLVDRGEVLGVLAVFDRRVVDEARRLELERATTQASLALGVAFESARLVHERQALIGALSSGSSGSPSGDVTLAGSSSPFRRVLAQVDVAAGLTAPVLIVGARGSGRTSTAECIHTRSARRAGPLLRVELQTRADDAEARLFGGEMGLLTVAEAGSVVLEDVDCLPPGAQRRLLAWLDDLESGDDRPSTARVMATSTLDPQADATGGRLLRGLVDRLAVIRIDLPSLAERGDDVVAVARELLTGCAKRLGREAPRLSPAAVDALRAYPWPGNVAELRAVIDRAVRICDDVLGPDALGLPELVTRDDNEGLSPILTRAQLRQRERESIRAALSATAGRVSGARGAATLLGMKPTTLASRIKSLGLGRAARRRRGAGLA